MLGAGQARAVSCQGGAMGAMLLWCSCKWVMCGCVGTTGERGWKGLSLHNLFPPAAPRTVCTAAAALAPDAWWLWCFGTLTWEASPTGQGLGHRVQPKTTWDSPTMTLAIFVVSQGLVATCFPWKWDPIISGLACTVPHAISRHCDKPRNCRGPLAHLILLTAIAIKTGSSGLTLEGKVASALPFLGSTNFH